MSLDERLRGSLADTADRIDADVDRALARVQRRSARTRRNRRLAVVAAAVVVVAGASSLVLRDDRHQDTVVAGPSQTSTPVTVPAHAAGCPDSYRFAYVPAGWTTLDGGVLTGPAGEVLKWQYATGTTSAPTVVGPGSLVGFPATQRIDAAGTRELRVNAPDPLCGGSLSVLGTGLDEQQFTFIASGFRPTYSQTARERFLGIWPSSDLELAYSRAESLTSPTHAAIEFLTDELGWTGGAVVTDEPARFIKEGHNLAVEGDGGPKPVQVIVVPIAGTGYFAVGSVSSFTVHGEDEDVSVSITASTETPDVVAAAFADAASADLQIFYGDHGTEVETTEMPPQFTFELGPRPDVPGAAIIRWHDASGAVVAITGSQLPPYDVTAG